MPAPKKATDEQILAALEEHGSVAAAAAALRMQTSAVYRRLHTDSLSNERRLRVYRKLENDLSDIHAGVAKAIRTLHELAEDSGPQDSVRMAAACRVIDYALKLREQMGVAEQTDKVWKAPPEFRIHVVNGGQSGD